jgi:formylglycine-generating enzyme required for sulfatase activity
MILVNVVLLLSLVGNFSGAVPPEMVLVPGGTCDSGLTKTQVTLTNFYIDAHEVTNKAYAEFLRRSGYVPKGNWEIYAKAHGDNAPVVGVTLADADAFAKCYKKRLPTAFEWERACSGLEGYAFPWGDQYEAERANVNSDRLQDVDANPLDVTPSGIFDLAGNVAEWTVSPIDKDSSRRAVMGGSYLFWERKAYEGLGVRPDTASQMIGFRCVWKPK